MSKRRERTSLRRPQPVFERRRELAVAAILAASLAACAAAVLLAGPGHLETMFRAVLHGHVAALRSELHALGTARAALALVLLVLAHTALPFPAELLAAAGGFALGLGLALPLLMSSFLASALLAYLVGWRLGQPVAARLVGAERLERVEERVRGAGARPLLAVRLLPLVPFSPLCLACGITHVPVKRYLWTTLVGMLPELALVAFLGTKLRAPQITDPELWAPLAGLVLLVLLSSTAVRRTVRTGRRRGSASVPAPQGRLR